MTRTFRNTCTGMACSFPRKWMGQRKKARPRSRRTAAGAINSWPSRRVRDGTTRTPMAMMDLHRGSYTGQFGFFMIDSANDPGLYDQEVFLALREWEPYLTTMDQDEERRIPTTRCPKNPPLQTRVPTGSKSALLFTRSTTKCSARGSPSACSRVSAS